MAENNELEKRRNCWRISGPKRTVSRERAIHEKVCARRPALIRIDGGLGMAKCLICNARKGKRRCSAHKGFVCSLCCGETRTFEKCNDCSFFQEMGAVRNYRKVTHYSLVEMSNIVELQDQCIVIESAICNYDDKQDGSLKDNVVERIVELLLDQYHFQDQEVHFANELEEDGFMSMDQAIREDLPSLQPGEITKLLATVHRSIKRHTVHGREYIDFIHQYVG